jgi:hypothetical protein
MQPPKQPPDDQSLRDPSSGTPRQASSRDDDSRMGTRNQRWEDDLDTDQMENLYGHEAIEDGEVTDDFTGDVSEDF